MLLPFIDFDPEYRRYEIYDDDDVDEPLSSTDKDNASHNLIIIRNYLNELDVTCKKHFLHDESDHKIYLYPFITNHINHIIEWQNKHIKLYDDSKHPKTCKYCYELKSFINVSNKQTETIKYLVSYFMWYCHEQCHDENNGECTIDDHKRKSAEKYTDE